MASNQSEWFKGLKFAEHVGAKEAYDMNCRNEFDGCECEFICGVMDYISHFETRMTQ